MKPCKFPAGLPAVTALVVGLVLGAGTARAQLPPSPTDTPPADSPGVRPTAPPRTPPPPPPDSRRPPATGPTRAAPPLVPPPPPPQTVVPPASPVPPAAAPDKVFGTRGVLELGGSLGFSFQADRVNESTWLNLALDAYAGYFVMKYFSLGVYLALSFSQNHGGGDRSFSVTPGVLLAPGVAVRLSRRVFFYGDLLGGLFVRQQEIGGVVPSRSTDVRGTIGGEVGVKLRIAGRLLLRFGVRPVYYVGKRRGEDELGSIDGDIGFFELLFRIGFSGFL